MLRRVCLGLIRSDRAHGYVNGSLNMCLNYAGKEFSQFKNDLGDLAVSKLSPISLEMNKLMNDKEFLDSIINTGKEKALSVAEPVLKKVYEIIGFLYR